MKVVSDASWDIQYTKGVYFAKPGDIVPFDFTYTQNGDIDAVNCYLDIVVPVGTTLLTTAPNAPAFTDGGGGTILTSVNSNGTARFTSARVPLTRLARCASISK